LKNASFVRVIVTSESHASCSATGDIYVDGPADYFFWSNYLEQFDEVVVLARVTAHGEAGGKKKRADGPGVSFYPLPEYAGPWQYLRFLPDLKVRVRKAITQGDAFILRVPGLVGRLAWKELSRRRIPYALEVVGDPWDALGPGTWPSLFRPIFRRAGARELKAMCQGAIAVHYVTQSTLQRRYPAVQKAYSTAFSDASMDSAFAPVPIIEERLRRISLNKPRRIGFIGSMAQLYKGPDVLLHASSLFRSHEADFEIVMLGDGRYVEQMKALATRLGVGDRTQFIAQLPFGKAIFEFLDSIDLFVMPSRAEGLPRALLEAMARGCPCIGSNIGGIPELLSAEDLVPANDHKALARKIMDVSADPQRMKAMSARNLARAKQFDPETLREMRRAFYDYVKTHSQHSDNSAAR
jgi:glycosyltransferase involved in cell wall biosynthesis